MRDDATPFDFLTDMVREERIGVGYWNRVLRIEHEDSGHGPYASWMALFWVDAQRRYTLESHPIPTEDGIPPQVFLGPHRHGFQSLDKLLEWFNDYERQTLEDHGFVIAVYEVPITGLVAGRKQVVFDPTQATKLKTVPPTKPEEAIAA